MATRQKNNNQEPKMSTKRDALIKLYHCLNGPVKVGSKYVTYTRDQAEAALDVLRQILINEGAEFRPPTTTSKGGA